MEGFRSAAGQLHMLFADEDEYYTDSISVIACREQVTRGFIL